MTAEGAVKDDYFLEILEVRPHHAAVDIFVQQEIISGLQATSTDLLSSFETEPVSNNLMRLSSAE